MEALIGGTPVLMLERLRERLGFSAHIAAKLEAQNPAGSVKDRAALYMINDAELRGAITKGATIIEPTSGNTGIGLCAIGAARGYEVVIVMPDTMSVERQRLMKAYGARLVLTDGALGMTGAIKEAERIASEIPNSIIVGQFSNPANVRAHYETTAPEIYEALDGALDAFVCGVGTGGTFTGIGKYLKEKKPDIELVAVEPASSPLLSRGESGAHGLQGIGANFVPEILDRSLIDRIMTVSEDDAFEMARLVARTEGLLIGISSAAALCAAVRLAETPEYRSDDKLIATIFPDSGERYLSSGVF